MVTRWGNLDRASGREEEKRKSTDLTELYFEQVRSIWAIVRGTLQISHNGGFIFLKMKSWFMRVCALCEHDMRREVAYSRLERRCWQVLWQGSKACFCKLWETETDSCDLGGVCNSGTGVIHRSCLFWYTVGSDIFCKGRMSTNPRYTHASGCDVYLANQS